MVTSGRFLFTVRHPKSSLKRSHYSVGLHVDRYVEFDKLSLVDRYEQVSDRALNLLSNIPESSLSHTKGA